MPEVIVIEVPVPQPQAEPEPEKPAPPLPTRKPAATQARREPAANGHSAVNGTPGGDQAPAGAAPNGGPAGGASSEAPAQTGGETAEPPPEPPNVVGLNRNLLVAQFGAPVAEHAAAPAKVLEFGNGDCRLSAFLYFDTARNDFYVLQYQVNGMSDRNEAADRCLMRIRDAARR